MHVDEESLVLTADPQGALPSVIPGVSVAELDEMLDNIRWFSRLSLSRRLAVAARHQRRARLLIAQAAARTAALWPEDGEARGA